MVIGHEHRPVGSARRVADHNRPHRAAATSGRPL